MRTKLTHLFIYHPHLDSTQTIQLLISFERGDLDLIRQFITSQNVNNSIGVCCFLPLELSIIYDHKHIFNYLVNDLNANINIKNKSFEPMTFVALAFQRRSYLFELLNLDISTLYACTNKSKRTLIHKAAIYNDIKTIKKLINDYGFYKNLNEFELSYLLYDKYNCTPLYYACWFGFTDIAEELIKCFYDNTSKKVIGNFRRISYKSDTADSSDEDDGPEDLFIIDNIQNKQIQLKDSSLSISILNNHYDCAKLLLTNSLKHSCLLKTDNYKISADLDSWFAGSMKLYSSSDYLEMSNIFHELVLNGAKFTNHLFVVIDSMNNLYYFNDMRNRGPPSQIVNKGNVNQLTKNEILQYKFVYTKCNSNYLKCLTFICNYNLESLFDCNEKCSMFLKSCFVKINELFLINNNWNLIDDFLIDKCLNQAAISEHFYYNQDAILQFLYDFEQFLKVLYTTSLSFKYFPKKKCFNFLRKFRFIYFIIESNLYSSSNFNLLELELETKNKLSIRNISEPLSLKSLAKSKVKSSLKYLDVNLINKLDLPKSLNDYLSAGLANGLHTSYERNKMNKLY